jgi:hypothetical protein
LAKWRISALNCLSPGTSLRLIKNVLDKVKRDLGNSPYTLDRLFDSVKSVDLTLMRSFEPELPFLFFGSILKMAIEKSIRDGLKRLAERHDI